MIKVIIIENKTSAALEIENNLNSIPDTFEIIGKAFSINSAIRLVKNSNPDLLFIATHLSDGIGYDVLDRITHKPFDVIFTTSDDKLTAKTFEYANILYIIKPLNKRKFLTTLQKYLYSKRGTSDICTTSKSDDHQNNNCDLISIPTSQGYQIIDCNSIHHLEADSSYTKLHLEDNIQLISSHSLKKFEQRLDANNFCRIHDKYIINLQHLLKYHKGRGGSVTLSSEINLPVSTRKRSSFLSKINIGQL